MIYVDPWFNTYSNINIKFYSDEKNKENKFDIPIEKRIR